VSGVVRSFKVVDPVVFVFESRVLYSGDPYNKEFLCITHTVEHNYISSSSTLGLQLHVSALKMAHI